MNRRGLLALVHCAQKDLGIDEYAYRKMLEGLTGKTSAKLCSDGELGRVVDHLRRLGWTPAKGGRPAPPPKGPSRNGHVRKVWAVWGDLCTKGVVRAAPDAQRGALKAFVKRMTGLDDPEWMSPHEANRVIEALKKWAERADDEQAERSTTEG
jgi:phage gp16-like protein